MREVNKNIAGNNWNQWYEAYITSEQTNTRRGGSVISISNDSLNTANAKKKKVYCYLSAKVCIDYFCHARMIH